jgi:hypothetical protein
MMEPVTMTNTEMMTGSETITASVALPSSQTAPGRLEVVAAPTVAFTLNMASPAKMITQPMVFTPNIAPPATMTVLTDVASSVRVPMTATMTSPRATTSPMGA